MVKKKQSEKVNESNLEVLFPKDESVDSKTNDNNSSESDSLEEKKESLLVLATLGMTKEYLGEEITVEKIHKFNKNKIEKLFSRYQQVQGKKVSDVLITKGIELGVKLIKCFLPIEDSEKLVQDLENDQLVNKELSNAIGLLVLRGGDDL